ncbi:MAG: Fic family protein [Chloroflexi bacterium]|nr:Fic family protein [Chloroflexota bacterium]
MHPLDKRLENLPAAIWTEIARIEELKGRWDASAVSSPQGLGRLKRSVLVTSTGASTRIEGARLSDQDVENLMRGIAIEKFADRDAQEVKGYFELLQNVFDAWEALGLNESTIKHLHQELLKYVAKDRFPRGQYKKTANKVQMIDAPGKAVGILFDTTPAFLTPSAMRDLVEWTQNALRRNTHHPLLTIANFLVEFLNIHPFQDGNGRLSRILMNLLLLQAGYSFMPYVSHEKLIEENKSDYYLALRTSQRTFKTKHADLTPWLAFFLKIIRLQAEMALDLMAGEQWAQTLSAKQLAVWQYLQTRPEATPLEIARATNVARPTVSQALEKLLRLKRIERVGEGRSTRYRVRKE